MIDATKSIYSWVDFFCRQVMITTTFLDAYLVAVLSSVFIAILAGHFQHTYVYLRAPINIRYRVSNNLDGVCHNHISWASEVSFDSRSQTDSRKKVTV